MTGNSIFDLQPTELADFLKEQGQPGYRARQVLRWAYRGASSYEEMSNLPTDLRAQLQERLPLCTLAPVQRALSPDGLTRKVLFRLRDGLLVEAVWMGHAAGKGRWRTTICISSQAGCAYGCQFCATGQQGYGRNLTSGEMVQQVVYFLRAEAGGLPTEQTRALGEEPVQGITNVVFMGMGEPFANYRAVRRAVTALNAPWGLGLGARHITVSTVGLAPEVRRFAQEPWQAGLAISLHAANDELRSSLVPVNRKYPLKELLAACRDYVARTHRRVTFEYVLLGGVNDSRQHARELAGLLSGLLCHVNLIPVNPTAAGQFKRPAAARIRAFVEEVERYHIPVTLRDTQGVEIQAGCGQLRARVEAAATRAT